MVEGDAMVTKYSRKKTKGCKRRFSDEQIRSMEVIFESEEKLDPKKKVEVARDLGLHPRQVAIWFQNKRARWKSKHMEKEYSLLLSNYNTLVSEFESLRKDNQSLLDQLQKLKSEVWMIGETATGDQRSKDNYVITREGLEGDDDELLNMAPLVDWTSSCSIGDSDDVIMNRQRGLSDCDDDPWWDFWS